MIEQKRAMLLAKTTAASSAAQPPNGGTTPSTPRQAAAQAMRAEDAQMSRFLRLLQESRDDQQPGEAIFGPTVPTSLSRREINRQGVGFADTAVAAVVSAAADRFLASVLQQSIPCRDQRLKGMEVARQAARERKRFRQKYERGIDERKRRKMQETKKRNAANQTAIRNAEELDNKTNAAKRKADSEAETNGSARTAANGVQAQRELIEASDINYDSVDEEDKLYMEHHAAFDDNNDDNNMNSDDEDDEDEVLILGDVARPLRAWGFHVDGRLTSDILTAVKPLPVASKDNTVVPDDDVVEDDTTNSQIQENGDLSNNQQADGDSKGKPTTTPNSSNHCTPTKRSTPPKGGDAGTSTKSKSPSTTPT